MDFFFYVNACSCKKILFAYFKSRFFAVFGFLFNAYKCLNKWFVAQYLNIASQELVSRLFVRHSSEDKRRNGEEIQWMNCIKIQINCVFP